MMPRLLHPLLALLASCTRQELARQVAYLKEENKILKARTPHRICTTAEERRRLIRAARGLGHKLKALISIVGYQTFRTWIREMEEERVIVPRGPRHSPGRITREFQVHYNLERPHEACGHLPPGADPPSTMPLRTKPSDIVCTTRLGGLLKSYSRRAA